MEESAIKFESLLVQMLDMGIGERVSTSTDIPRMLSMKGWDQAQVANVWTVSAVQDCSSSWNEKQMELLGGKGILSRVWNNLKGSEKTGNSKRCADVICSDNAKKRRQSHPQDAFKSEVSTVVQNKTPPKDSATVVLSNELLTPKPVSILFDACESGGVSAGKRRKLRPRRKKVVQGSKITAWLTDPSSPSQLRVPAAPLHPKGPTEHRVPADPSQRATALILPTQGDARRAEDPSHSATAPTTPTPRGVVQN